MKKADISILESFKNRVSAKCALIEMRAFGSRVRGDADKYSDFDVFVEIEAISRETKECIEDIAWEVGFENLVHISPLVYSRHDIEQSPHRASPVVRTIMREGVKI
jgi:predicted nucleotidyltransferase